MYETQIKVLTIGGATQDTFIIYENPQTITRQTAQGERTFIVLEQGSKINVSKLEHHTGGGATNSAVAFKRLGFEVTTCFKVGTDKAGEFILKQLAGEHINLQPVVKDANVETGVAFILPSPTGDRTVLVYRGANCTIMAHEVPTNHIAQSNVLYITSLSGQSAKLLLPIAQQARKQSALVATNPGNDQVANNFDAFKQALAYIDIVLMNSDEARLCLKSMGKTAQGNLEQWLPEFFATMVELGPRMVGVTDGPNGAYATDGKQIYYHPTLPTTIANTLGAGDAFGSCFVARIAQQKTVQEALVCGIINSTSVVSHFGAKEGLLTQDALQKKFASVGTKLVKTYDMNSIE